MKPRKKQLKMTLGERRLLGLAPPLPERRPPVLANIPGGAFAPFQRVFIDLSMIAYENGTRVQLYVQPDQVADGAGGALRLHHKHHPHMPRGVA